MLRGPRPIISEGRESTDYGLVIGNDVSYRLVGPAGISLRARMLLRTSRRPVRPDPWQVSIIGYQYTLFDHDQREILAFHLHPEGQSHVVTPHLHLGAGAGQLRADLGVAHIPTGSVTLAAAARLAIEAFSARPQRASWDGILLRSNEALAASHSS